MKWRVFYADGVSVTSDQCDWASLPSQGVVIAVWWDDRGIRHLDCGADSLVNTGQEIVSVNLPTLPLQRAAKREATAGVLKYGVYMEPESWAKIRAKAEEARD